MSEEQGALPMLQGRVPIPGLVSSRTAKIHCINLKRMACLAVLQRGNEGEKEQKKKKHQGRDLKRIFPSFCIADTLST